MALGVILTPYGANSPYGWYAEVTGAYGGNGTYLKQSPYPTFDRFWNSRGEPGFYYDTQLGAWQPKTPVGLKIKAAWDKLFKRPAPIAARASLPRGSGAIPSDAELSRDVQCYTPVASGWTNTQQGFVPGTWRFGWNPAGDYGPPSSLGDATATDLITATNAHNARMFQLAIISTAAVSLSALFTLWTRYRRLRLDMRKRR